MTDCLIGLAAVAGMSGLNAAGARLLAAFAAITGLPNGSPWPPTQIEFTRYQELVHSGLSKAELQAEQVRGSAMTLDQALDDARNLLLSPKIAPVSKIIPDALTNREREVAALVAQGKANGEIAAELVLSKRTVEKHVANILSKLSLSSRAQIVRWWLENGLNHHSL